MPTTPFIERMKQVPGRIEFATVMKFGDLVLIKAKPVMDLLIVAQNVLPESLKVAKRKGLKSSFQTFKTLVQIEKMVSKNSFLSFLGLAYLDKKQFGYLIKEACEYVKMDMDKAAAILDNQ